MHTAYSAMVSRTDKLLGMHDSCCLHLPAAAAAAVTALASCLIMPADPTDATVHAWRVLRLLLHACLFLAAADCYCFAMRLL
jgi:hypothetical protein